MYTYLSCTSIHVSRLSSALVVDPNHMDAAIVVAGLLDVQFAEDMNDAGRPVTSAENPSGQGQKCYRSFFNIRGNLAI